VAREHGFAKWNALRAITSAPPAVMTSYDKSVAIVLVLHADARGECYPGVELLAAETSLSKSTVLRTLQRLAAGIPSAPIRLERSWRPGRRASGFKSRVYRIVLAKQDRAQMGVPQTPIGDPPDVSSMDRPMGVPQTPIGDPPDVSSMDRPMGVPQTPIGSANGCPPDTCMGVPQTPTMGVPQTPEGIQNGNLQWKPTISQGAPVRGTLGGGQENQAKDRPMKKRSEPYEDEPSEPVAPALQPVLPGLASEVPEDPAKAEAERIAAAARRVWHRHLALWSEHVNEPPRPVLTDSRRAKLRAAVKRYGEQQVLDAVEYLFDRRGYHGSHGYWQLEYVIRGPHQFEKIMQARRDMLCRIEKGTVRPNGGNGRRFGPPLQRAPEGHVAYEPEVVATDGKLIRRDGSEIPLDDDDIEFNRRMEESARRVGG
jgi:hypothetical protein